jgi:hypothetical protein
MAAAAPIMTAAAGAKMTADASAGIIRQFMNAMGHPLFSNATTTTVTHIARNGDVVVRTREHGWNLTVGMVLGGLLIMAIWEFFAGGMIGGLGQVGEEVPGGLGSLFNETSLFLNAAKWPQQDIQSLFHGSPQTISVPPSFLASLNQIGLQMSLPFLAGAQQIGGTGAATIGEWLQKGVQAAQSP